MVSLHDELKSGLKPLYKDLLQDNTLDNICTFCMQWGENFPKEKNTGILFVGKAVNGWINEEIDIDVLFGESPDKIFSRDNQMIWVHNSEGSNDGYNSKKSAFWRVAKKISQHYYPDEEWYTKVAWSNLCKIAPFQGGNPNNKLYYEQLDSSKKILEKEIEILSPRIVVMMTSGWENDFLYYLNDNKQPVSEVTIDWHGYQTKVYRIKDTIYIATPHPQGKDETKHFEVITNSINEYR